MLRSEREGEEENSERMVERIMTVKLHANIGKDALDLECSGRMRKRSRENSNRIPPVRVGSNENYDARQNCRSLFGCSLQKNFQRSRSWKGSASSVNDFDHQCLRDMMMTPNGFPSKRCILRNVSAKCLRVSISS